MLEVFDCEQNSPDWMALRRGIVTASEFGTVMAKGRGGAESKTRRKYLLTLAADRLGGDPGESFSNIHTERGHKLEPEARDLYALIREVEPQQVGFVRNGDVGASPDSLIGSNGLLEIKTKLPALQLECLLADEFPAEHKAQCQGALWVTQREWVDLASYWPGLPLFIKRAYRDERYIATIKVAVDEFVDELNALVDQLRRMQ